MRPLNAQTMERKKKEGRKNVYTMLAQYLDNLKKKNQNQDIK